LFIPLKDDNPPVTFPLVTIGLILANGWVFFHQISLDVVESQRFIFQWGAIPHQLVTGQTLYGPSPVPVYFTLLSSMFLHGGFLHLFGNMLYLWIFGNNVEDSMGKIRFALFYLLCGLGAALGQVMVSPSSRVPMVGASGAVSGVLGAYLLLFPRARVLTLIPLGLFTQLVEIPAMLVLGFWIVIQLLNGLLTFNFEEGGVAWFAHVGGFAVGMLLVGLFKRRWVPWGWQRRRMWYD